MRYTYVLSAALTGLMTTLSALRSLGAFDRLSRRLLDRMHDVWIWLTRSQRKSFLA